MRTVRTVVASVVVVAALAQVDLRAESPWTLTLEERIARRCDPERAEARRRAHAAGLEPGRRPPAFVIDGSRNPEAFLPGELALSLAIVEIDADPTHAQFLRDTYAEVLAKMGWNATIFWADFRLASATYVRLVTEYPGPLRDEQTNLLLCRSRYELLHEMRKRYERFDEFLYTAVAPRRTVGGVEDPPRERLLWMEQGCK